MNLGICLPAYRNLPPRVRTSHMKLSAILQANGIPWGTVEPEQCAWLDVTMNLIIHDVRKVNADGLLWLDDDITFEAEDALGLITSGYDCIGGDYPLKKRGAGMVCGRLPGFTGDIVPCASIGLGFSFISRSAIEKMITANQHTAFLREGTDPRAGEISYELFERQRIDGRSLDPDIVFFKRMHEAGITPMVDTRIQLGHIGQYEYTAKDATP